MRSELALAVRSLRRNRAFAAPVVATLALGVVAAAALPRALRAAIPGVAGDSTTLAAMAALFLGVAALACWMPARRAARVDPVEALRSE